VLLLSALRVRTLSQLWDVSLYLIRFFEEYERELKPPMIGSKVLILKYTIQNLFQF
jgi:hypothetical protein